MRNLKKIFFGALLLSFTLVAWAASPIDMLESTSQQMLSALKSAPNKNQDTLYRIVQRVLLPQVDLDYMSQLVVNQSGPQGNYWGAASAQQKQAFKTAFTRYVTRTYSNALANYDDEKIVFSPRITQIGNGRIQVNSRVYGGGQEAINLNYRLIQSGGQWKVYDLIVDSISMVNSYNEQFGSVLRQSGMNGLLQRLQQHVAK